MKQENATGWSTGKDLIKSFQFHTGLDSDRMVVLNAVWEKEWGYFGHWKLTGVKKRNSFSQRLLFCCGTRASDAKSASD